MLYSKDFVGYISKEDNPLVFSEDLINQVFNILSFKDLKFIILRGISGIGKTLLIKEIVRFIYKENYQNFYLNYSLTSQYKENIIINPEINNFIYKSFKDINNLYFLHIEKADYYIVDKYLSPLLNIIENQDKFKINNELIKPNFNLIISIDILENNYSNLITSDILDRGFVISFLDLEFKLLEKKVSFLYKQKISKDLILEFFKFFKELYILLKPYNLHFAYRTIYQSLNYLTIVLKDDIEDKDLYLKALDDILMSKILVKIKGDHKISSLVRKLRDLIKQTLSQESKSYKVLSKMISVSTKTNTFKFFNYNYEQFKF